MLEEIERFVLTFATLCITLEMHHVMYATSIVTDPDNVPRKNLSMNRKTNGERELVHRDNNEAQLAYSKVAALHKRPTITMTDKHPMLTPATLESNCFDLMPTVLWRACHKNQQFRKHSHLHMTCLFCFFLAASIFCPTLNLSLMPMVLFEYA